jgi:hypothetical protein
MFSSANTPVAGEGLVYDFDDEENALKWKGVFVASLHKVVFLFLFSTVFISSEHCFVCFSFA